MPPDEIAHRNRGHLFDILHAICLALDYVEGMTRSEFDADTKTQDAVIRRLIVIGEATKRLDDTFRTDHSGLPWKEMAGMRDVIVHEYDRVDWDTVWTVLHDKLPPLVARLEALLPSQ